MSDDWTPTRTLILTITERFQYDPERTDLLYVQLRLTDFGATADDRALAVFEQLYDSQLHDAVFYSGNGPDTGYEFEDYDPDA